MQVFGLRRLERVDHRVATRGSARRLERLHRVRDGDDLFVTLRSAEQYAASHQAALELVANPVPFFGASRRVVRAAADVAPFHIRHCGLLSRVRIEK
jgi:hypothetical protein